MKKIRNVLFGTCAAELFVLGSVNNAHSGAMCAFYYVEHTCSSSYSYTTYGSTTGASSSTTTCYREYDSDGTFHAYRKYIRPTVCNTARGYSGPTTSTSSACIGSATVDPSTIYYGSCSCTGSGTWADISGYVTGGANRYNCSVSSYQWACRDGYYGPIITAGSPNSANAGGWSCTACPSNATCSGYANTTFTCNAGYYKNSAGTACTACPTNSTSPAGSTAKTDCVCYENYFQDSSAFTACAKCPTAISSYSDSTLSTLIQGKTTSSNNVYITSCYIQDGTYYDTTGTFDIYVDDGSSCFYVSGATDDLL